MTLYQVAEDISGRLASVFLRSAGGRRSVCGCYEFQDDPYWRDLMHLATTTPEQVLELSKLATTVDVEPGTERLIVKRNGVGR
jgi:hypothetical protein